MIANALYQVQRPTRMLGLSLSIILLALPALCIYGLAHHGLGQFSDFAENFNISATIYALKIGAWQAALSTAGSLILGILTARALFRRSLSLLHKPFIYFSFIAMITPTTVAGGALLSLWGRKGLLHEATGLSMPGYGLWLVVLAHMFFNAPLVMRVALSALEAVPNTQWRIASQLGMSSLSLWRHIEWPAVKAIIRPLAAIIFLLCFSSFSLVLMLGGGPKVTTLEVAIYTAVRFDFDMFSAAMLALIQLVISAGILIILTRGNQNALMLTPNPQKTLRVDARRWTAIASDISLLIFYALLIIAPLISLLLKLDIMAGAKVMSRPLFWDTFWNSVQIAICSSVLTCSLATLIILADFRQQQAGHSWRTRLGNLSVSIYLVMPAIVFGTGVFILLHRYIDVFTHAFWLVLMANLFLALPFAVRLLEGRLYQMQHQIDPLATSLNIHGMRRFWRLILPAMPREYGLALGLSAALSLGDLGVIALFGSRDFQTLPWLLYQLYGRYGGAQADFLAFSLLCLTMALYILLNGFVRLSVWLAQRQSRALSAPFAPAINPSEERRR